MDAMCAAADCREKNAEVWRRQQRYRAFEQQAGGPPSPVREAAPSSLFSPRTSSPARPRAVEAAAGSGRFNHSVHSPKIDADAVHEGAEAPAARSASASAATASVAATWSWHTGTQALHTWRTYAADVGRRLEAAYTLWDNNKASVPLRAHHACAGRPRRHVGAAVAWRAG